MVLMQYGMPHAAAARAARISPSAQKQAGEPGGTDGQRHRHRRAQQSGRQRYVRHVDHDALTKGHRIEVGGIAPQRAFFVGAAGGVVENGARDALAREFPQVVDAQNHPHQPLPSDGSPGMQASPVAPKDAPPVHAAQSRPPLPIEDRAPRSPLSGPAPPPHPGRHRGFRRPMRRQAKRRRRWAR